VSGNITQYNGTDIVTSAIASVSPDGRNQLQKSGTTVEAMTREINLKLNVGNRAVYDKGCSLTLDYPGDGTIGQIGSIYEYMVGNWSYKRDIRGIEVLQYSNQSLEYGNGKYSGQGDCDDFSILQASLIESIGCTSRIILAYGPVGGHAYTEVYMGTAGGPESDVGRMISWLKKRYKVNEINTHTDLKTGDVWLNLDWWKDPNTGTELSRHPGGPFFKAANQIPILIREDIPWVPLKPMNDLPVGQFAVLPGVPNAGEITTFNASKSKDIGGRIVAYEWDFGDSKKTGKLGEPEVKHIYPKGGSRTVILKVEDDEGATNLTSQNITVNNPPQANFTITPQNPVVDDLVKFDASASYDEEDGKNLVYNWQMDNNSATFSQVSPPKQEYEQKGSHWINLTVIDQNGAKGFKSMLLKVNQPPKPHISVDEKGLSAKRFINFSAASSEDLDGKIISYIWDFGDNSSLDHNETALHRYENGGNETVKLTLKDNDGAVNSTFRKIYVDWPPEAMFSFDPKEPKKGEPVSFDASASFDPDGKIQRYLWKFGLGQADPILYYSDIAEYTYTKPNKYNVTLTVEDDKGATSSFSQLVVVEVNNKPNIISLLPDKPRPQEAGAIITWTANASDPEDDQLLYRFFLNETPVTGWSNSSSWIWKTSIAETGNNTIAVRVKDGKHGEEGDDFNNTRFCLNKTRDPKIWLKKGNDLLNQSKYDEAIQAFDISFELDRSSSWPLIGKGKAFFAEGEYNTALDWFTRAIELTPKYELHNIDYAQIWYNMGKTLKMLHRCDDASDAFTKAEELDPSMNTDIEAC